MQESKIKIKFNRNIFKNIREWLIGPFNYDIDEEVDKAADIIEIMEKWHVNYEYVHDESNHDIVWLKSEDLYYEPEDLIQEYLGGEEV